jgi:CBS domain-containing protein
MKVKEIMTTPVVTASPGTPLGDVARLLRTHRISGVPVTDDGGAVVGLVSEHDLMTRQGRTVAEVMTVAVVTVTEDADVDDVRDLLVDRRIRRVPVLAGQRLAGIVSRSDIVALLVMEWVCQVCGEVARGQGPPARCPRCGTAAERFVQQLPAPGD